MATINGTSGNDVLTATSGADTINGMAGFDTVQFTGSGAVNVNLGAGTASGGNAAGDVLNSIEGLMGGSGNDVLVGRDDTLTQTVVYVPPGWEGEPSYDVDRSWANDGDNLLAGGQGNDSLSGGGGDDTYVFNIGDGVDTVTDSYYYNQLNVHMTNIGEEGSPNYVWTYIVGYTTEGEPIYGGPATDYTLTHDNGGNDTLLLGAGITAENIVITQSGANDVIIGIRDPLQPGQLVADMADKITLVNWMDALDRIETIRFADNSTLNATQIAARLGVDQQDGTSSGETLTGNSADNILSGGGGNDTLNGGGGNDTLNGGTGADTMVGGTGDDLYIVDNTGDTITENSGEGTDSVLASVSYTLAANVENLTLTGSSNIDGTGNGLANVITGNSGNNTLDGAGGNDTINGGAGADTMIGGAGNDIFIVDNTGDTVSENASEGSDTVQSSVTYTLSGNVEDLTLTGSSNIDATGNGLGNVLTGNSGNNTLFGGTGSDTLYGGAGTDYLDGGDDDDTLYAGAGDYDYLSGGDGNDVLYGSDETDVMDGGAGNDSLYGGAGNYDYFNGGAGNDLIDGGAGIDDRASYESAAFGITVDLSLLTGQVIDDGDGGTDTLVGIETVYGSSHDDEITGSSSGGEFLQGMGGNDIINTGDGGDGANGNDGNDTLTGGSGTDSLNGGAGDDIIDGGSGNYDFLVGGAGNDYMDGGSGDLDRAVYLYEAPAGITVDLSLGSGQVTNDGYGGVDTLVNIEEIWASNYADSITGSSGNDMISGYGGDDTITTGAGSDNIHGNDGIDTLSGGDDNDSLDGGAGNDLLYGGDSSDWLVGDAGNDYMDGGNGIDAAIYRWSATSGITVDLSLGSAQVTNDGQGGGIDTLVGIETIWGSEFGDTITGSSANESFLAWGGNDTLNGGGGNDYFDAGDGDDTITGGSGDDSFYFYTSSGNDTITDFAAGSSSGDIMFIGSYFADYTAASAALSQDGSDVLLALGGGNSIRIQSVLVTDLNAGDFGF